MSENIEQKSVWKPQHCHCQRFLAYDNTKRVLKAVLCETSNSEIVSIQCVI